MATPHVTGVAALLLSINPNLTATQAKECILQGADIITIITGDNEEQDVKKLNAWGAFVYMIKNYFPGEVSQTTLFGTSYAKVVNASSDIFSENTFLHKIDARMGGTHNITVSGNGALKVVLYNENLEEITTVNNGASNVTITYNLSSGKVYYIKATYTDSTSSGTITMRLTRKSTSHTHSYTQWKYKTAEKHIQVCSTCGAEGTVLSNHVIRASEIVGNKAPCLECGHMINIDDGFSQIIQNVAKISANGSYILTNGIVVLVDEDVEAYLNGTLVFYDKDDVPVTQ